MVPDVEIVYHDFARSEALERHIQEQLGELAVVRPDIRTCRVTLEQPNERCGCQVCLEVSARPGEDLMTLRAPSDPSAVFGVVDAGFDSAKDQLGKRAEATRRMEVLSAL